MTRKKALFLIGSPNQTTQMHQIARLLEDEPMWNNAFFRVIQQVR